MTEPLAIIRNVDELQMALRARAEALNISRQVIDDLAGLTPGHASKLLAPRPIKRLGPQSLADLLPALGTKLALIECEESMAVIGPRYMGKRMAGRAVHAAASITFSARQLREMRLKGGKNSRKNMSKRKASQLARKAVRARWNKPKLTEIKPKKIGTRLVDLPPPAPKPR